MVCEKFSRFNEKLCGLKNEVYGLAESKRNAKKLELVKEEGTTYSIEGFGEVDICNIGTLPFVQPGACNFIE